MEKQRIQVICHTCGAVTTVRVEKQYQYLAVHTCHKCEVQRRQTGIGAFEFAEACKAQVKKTL